MNLNDVTIPNNTFLVRGIDFSLEKISTILSLPMIFATFLCFPIKPL